MKHMVYSDDENKRWWEGLGKTGQAEILGLMLEKTEGSDFAFSLSVQYQSGKALSPKQLAAIRKWDK